MGDCIYCKLPAGFLRKKHKECFAKHEAGYKSMYNDLVSRITQESNFDELEKSVIKICSESYISETERKSCLIKAWEISVDSFLENGVIDNEEEIKLVNFQKQFNLSQSDLDKNGALTKTAQSVILREICNGVLPSPLNISGNIPVNLQKNEQIIWVFQNSKYLEDKSRRKFVGGSQGVSLRIAKGVYYRVGSFKGNSVSYTERVHVDTGAVIITNKHIYFAGPKKSMRVPFAKIVSFEPFSDGLGIMRDAASAKPQIFVTGEGWFIYNLVSNLSQM